jgi:hypothetical protein
MNATCEFAGQLESSRMAVSTSTVFIVGGWHHVFFSIFTVVVFFPSSQTAPVWRG